MSYKVYRDLVYKKTSRGVLYDVEVVKVFFCTLLVDQGRIHIKVGES